VRVERVEEVKGSEWNTGSYFWEERTIPWANDKLNELLNALEFNLPGGSVRLKTVEAKGQSSYSVRKGKKILTFNYEIDIDWEAMLKDGEGNSLA
jgi:activator of HSP90 ATPase